MNRNEFITTMAAAIPAVASSSGAAAVPTFANLAESEAGKVKITDVKFMRVKIGDRGHVMPLVKIETDAGSVRHWGMSS